MILFLPESRPGFGSGHARRSFEAARALRDREVAVCLSASNHERLESLRRILISAFDPDSVAALLTDQAVELGALPQDTEMVVLDSPRVEESTLREVRRQALAVGLDAGGPGREACDYLLDTLPRLRRSSPANYVSTALLQLPRRRRTPEETSSTAGGQLPGDRDSTGLPDTTAPELLISFGGEDSRGLTRKALKYVLRRGIAPERIAVTLPGAEGAEARRPAWLPPEVVILRAPGSLREELYRFSRVITAFGLTAFEAEAAGAQVLLMHPTAYHRKLAAQARLISLTSAEGRRRLDAAPVRGAQAPAGEASPTDFADPDWRLPKLIARLKEAGQPRCPVCGQAENPVLARQEERTHYRCRACTMVFSHRFQESGIAYDGSYFFEEYQAQYGRSYVDDLPDIIRRGRERLDFLEGAGGLRPPASALDLGCAFGAFLTALSERGYKGYGVDVSPEAIDYCKAQGQSLVWAGDLRTLSRVAPLGPSSFDLVTLWFVIEHFPDLGSVLETISALVADPPAPGLLAFSTPNLSGISGRKSLSAFLRGSPGDHATVWSPRIARKVLPRFGFEVLGVRVTGHHPERIPGFRGLRPGSVAWRIMAAVSRIFRLGDTFEVVARKRGSARSDAR